MRRYKLTFRVHAIQRMFQRHIGIDDVHRVLENGETIEEYPEDTPYPSRLVLGWCGRRPLHIVVADNNDSEESIIVTVYEPSQNEWKSGFRRRK